MGWELRSGRRVYYRKERYTDEEGRSHVRSIYCGSGERGEVAARQDEERRDGVTVVASAEVARATPALASIGDVKKAAPPISNPLGRCNGARRNGGPVTADEIIERGLARVGHLDDAAKGERERLLRRMVEGGDRDFRLAAAFVGISTLELRTRGVEFADY
jgi:hypothetical protein